MSGSAPTVVVADDHDGMRATAVEVLELTNIRPTQEVCTELFEWAKRLQAPLPLVQEVAEMGWLPVPLFCAGGIATPADAALAMQLGAEAVFVGSGIFKSDEPAPRAKAIVEATTHFRDPAILAKVSRDREMQEMEALYPGYGIGGHKG